MDKVYVMRRKVPVERRSISSVARELGVSRNTVSKYFKGYEPIRKPGFALRPRPVTDKVVPRINKILSGWAGRTTPKQRVTGSLIHRQLLRKLTSGHHRPKLLDECATKTGATDTHSPNYQ